MYIRRGSSGGASIVKTVMVVACFRQIVTFTLLFTANICDLSRALMSQPPFGGILLLDLWSL